MKTKGTPEKPHGESQLGLRLRTEPLSAGPVMDSGGELIPRSSSPPCISFCLPPLSGLLPPGFKSEPLHLTPVVVHFGLAEQALEQRDETNEKPCSRDACVTGTNTLNITRGQARVSNQKRAQASQVIRRRQMRGLNSC